MFNNPLKARTNLKKCLFGLKQHAVGYLCQESLLNIVVDFGQSKAELSPCLPECEILTLF